MKAPRQTLQNQQHYTKAIDITFTIILVFLTLVFGDYVLKTIDQPKKVSVKKAFTNVVLADPKKQFSQKQNLKVRRPIFTGYTKKKVVRARSADTTQKVENIAEQQPKPAVVTPVPADPAPPKESPILPVAAVNTTPDYLYVTYLTSNETGVINMRKAGFYNAEVIKTIPSNSNVFVLAKGEVYYKIRFDNSTGYVPRWTVAAK